MSASPVARSASRVTRHIPPVAGPREWASLAVLTLSVVLLAVDSTVLLLAVPALTRDLNPTANELLWIGDVYSFALAGLLVLMGNLADRFGRKRVLLVGAVAFAAASTMAAFCTDPGLLVAARAAQGVAAATLMPSTLSLIRNIFMDARQRTRAIAIWSAGASGGAVLGPMVGGVLLEHYWWGSVFLINLPVMLVLVVAGAWLLPESRNPQPGRLDMLGAVQAMVAIVAVVYAIKDLAGYGPSVGSAVVALVGLVSGIAFVRRQGRVKSPLIDVTLFANRTFSGALVTQLLALLALSGLLFFFSQYLQLVRGHSPLQAGLRELPLTVASILVIAVVGTVVSRLGVGRGISLGLGLTAVGLIGLAITEGLPGYAWMAVALVVLGCGFGLAFTLSTDAAVGAVQPQKAGSASAMSETSYELGVALGVALLGSLQTVLYRLSLPEEVAEAGGVPLRESLASGVARLADAPGAGSLLAEARESFTWAMQLTSVLASVVLVVAAVVAWRVIPSRRPASAVPVVEAARRPSAGHRQTADAAGHHRRSADPVEGPDVSRSTRS